MCKLLACYACEIHKDSLENEGELRTIGSLIKSYEKYWVKEGETDQNLLSKTVLSLTPPPSLYI